ncbi:PAS domain-containing sensor histidine kinase [Actinacidiphila guanduensis]|uniref:histidine kinase n=1 Tax=Actinacidiphila guanduensis TaxID=310781 RepID=A0A1H0SCS4_9ACTN|nr:PAS domain S-box protein [Actinacidiphila guanduensis]SDP39309.1 PAS domain S-box-containing protein [Actinacidiphila guanduensis]
MFSIGEVLPVILDSVPQVIWVVDHEGGILYTNPAGVAVLGYDDAEELVGLSSHETLHPYRPDGTPFPASQCPMLRPASSGVPAHGDDEWFKRRDGSFFPASWWSAPVELPGGRGVVYSFFDATESRELERARLERDAARIRAGESRAAQRRIMQSIASVRRQTARDLHDGAQQRLVSLLIGLRLTRDTLSDSADTAGLLDGAIADAQAAIDELRELAYGVYPSILTVKGLMAAVQSLADRCPVPTTVTGDANVHLLPAEVQSNAYFVIAEAVTNTVKHAKASHIRISISFQDSLCIEVADDGVGGVSQKAVTGGLAGLTDRVSAFEGVLVIDSPAGRGTLVRAEIPVPR